MANEKTPVVWDDDAKKHRPLGSGEKMGGLSASSMISSDSGNLLQQGSDGLMLVAGSSLADPRADNLLEESANGKLQVTSDRVVEWLEGHPQAAAAIAEAVKVVSEDSGNVIVQGSDKGAFMSKDVLTSAVSEMTPAQMSALADALRQAGGGLNVDPATGKLVVDFGSMDPAIMRNVVLSMVQQGGGIAVDQSGKLYVDFSQMPTDKFEDLLKSLNMQIPLTQDIEFIVDTDNANAGDSIVDGRGTAAKPFKTIGACASYAASTYALGNHSIWIRVKAGNYSERAVLPETNRGSGVIHISAYDYSTPPVVGNSHQSGSIISVTGGSWVLRRLKLVGSYSRTGSSAPVASANLVSASNGGICSIYGCQFISSYVGEADTVTRGIRLISCSSNAVVYLMPMETYFNNFEFHKGNAYSMYGFYIERGAELIISSSNDSNVVTTFPCTGDCNVFARAAIQSRISVSYSGLYKCTFVNNSVTGIKYSATDGSGIFAPIGGFPGTDGSGDVEGETYSWYKQYAE